MAELDTIQKANGGRYIGAFKDGKKIFEEEIAKGDIRSAGFDLNGIWAPIYTQHKIMMGLIDAYKLCGNKKALQINKNFADWLGSIVQNLTHEQVQKCFIANMVGLMRRMQNYMRLQVKRNTSIFHECFIMKLFWNLFQKESIFCPAYMLIHKFPKVIGLARRYELTADSVDRKTAEFFGTGWCIITLT